MKLHPNAGDTIQPEYALTSLLFNFAFFLYVFCSLYIQYDN